MEADLDCIIQFLIKTESVSSSQYPATLTGAEQEVELQGESYFEVANNKNKPFTLKSGSMCVEVLGTNFNIMAYQDEMAMKTTLWKEP